MTVDVKGKWRRRSREEWQSVFARFGASGLGVEPFCEREGLSESSFRRWRSLLAPEAQRPKVEAVPERVGFVDAGVLGGGGGRLDIRLELGDGVVLHLKRG